MTLYHLATFWSERDDTNVALFHYADMSRDLDGEMRRLATFLDIDVPDPKWSELVDAASFANMQARSKELAPEATQGFVNANNFFRRGTSGDWREFIDTESDQTHYEARVGELADPELAHWAHSGRADVPSARD